MYTTLKFIHVVAAIVWIGSGFALLIVTLGMLRARDYTAAAGLGRQIQGFGKTVFGPAAMITLIAGVVMVIVGDLSFADAWIVIGLAGVALSFVLGAGLGERASKQLQAALPSDAGAAATASDDAAIDRLRTRLAVVSGADLTVLLIVVWAMVFKPGL